METLVSIFVKARNAGKAAFVQGLAISANPFSDTMIAESETNVREHEMWNSGWNAAKDQAEGWPNG